MKSILKEKRQQLGLTMLQVAQYVGVSEGTISRWEGGQIANMRRDKIARLSEILKLSPSVIAGIDQSGSTLSGIPTSSGVRIPVFASVPAGIPLEAIEDIVDFEVIPTAMAKNGEYFSLRVTGDSMEPRIKEGDIVIARRQEAVDNGDLAVVMVNSSDATLKRFYRTATGVKLVSSNPKYDPFFFTPAEVDALPVRVIGKVVELRAKF